MTHVAVGLITRNRPVIAAKAIEKHLEFLPEYASLFVYEDGSDDDKKLTSENSLVHNTKKPVHFLYSFEESVGVAAGRNKLLKLMYEEQPEATHFVVMDDDVFPKKADWILLYLEALKAHPEQHLLKAAPTVWANPNVALDKMLVCSNTTAVMFFMTRKLVEIVGGFDTSLGTYGYEDGDYYARALRSGLTPYGAAVQPKSVEKYIHVCDVQGDFEDLIWPGKSVLYETKKQLLKESLAKTQEKYANGDEHIPIYIPFRRPTHSEDRFGV